MTIDVEAVDHFSSNFYLPENPNANGGAQWNANFQGHHLIPTHIANKFGFLKALDQIRVSNSEAPLYGHNNFNENGMWLPSHEADSLASGLALHRGGHASAYNNLVEDILIEIERKHNLSGLSNSTDFSDQGLLNRLINAAKELDAVGSYLRDGLIANRVADLDGAGPDRMAPKFMINASDPHASAIGGFESGYPANAYSDYESFLNIHFTNGDPVNGTPSAYYLAVSDAANPNLTNANGDVASPFERRASIDPSLDTSGIERFSSQSQLVNDPNAPNPDAPSNPLSSSTGVVGLAILSATGIVLVSSDPAAADEIAADINTFLQNVDSDSIADFAATAVVEKTATATLFGFAGAIGGIAYVGYEIGLSINDVGAVLNYFDQKFPHWEWVDYAKPVFDVVTAITQYLPEFEVDVPEFVALDNIEGFQGDNSRQAILATGDTDVNAGGGNDWIAHTGSGVVRGEDGNDSIVARTQYEGGAAQSLTIEGGAGDDWVVAINLAEQDNPQSRAEERQEMTVDTGSGDDWVMGFGAATIYLGAGSDRLISAGTGSVIHTGPGGADDADSIHFSRGSLIADADGFDTLYMYGVLDASGTYYRYAGSENPYAYGNLGLIKVGINTAGELVVGNLFSNPDNLDEFVYFANPNTNPSAPTAELTAGIRTGEIEIANWQLLDGRPEGLGSANQQSMWDFMRATVKEFYDGNFAGGTDPLVLDLDGDGIELTALAGQTGPMFDMDGDGFLEHTGWVMPDDGLLTLDLNGNGTVDDISELFGSVTTSGFTELAAHDSNGDGIIDSSDTEFANLKVWQDANRDGISQADELSGLADLGIASISLTATDDGSQNALNTVARTGSFTRTDGSTGTVGDINFRINNHNTAFAGDTSVDPAIAASQPNLKGYGTLTDLHVALTMDADQGGTLGATVDSVLPKLDVPDFGLLKERGLTILNAWA